MTTQELDELCRAGEIKWLRWVKDNFPVLAPYYFNTCSKKYTWMDKSLYEDFEGNTYNAKSLDFETVKALVADLHKFHHHDEYNRTPDWATESLQSFSLCAYKFDKTKTSFSVRVGQFAFDIPHYCNKASNDYATKALIWRKICDFFGVDQYQKFEKIP